MAATFGDEFHNPMNTEPNRAARTLSIFAFAWKGERGSPHSFIIPACVRDFATAFRAIGCVRCRGYRIAATIP
jgi:hypothetical protein